MIRKSRCFAITQNNPHAVHFDLGNMRIRAEQEKAREYKELLTLANWYINLLRYTLDN
jgi:hypothetical protein